ncbi:hypothetical protein GCM10028778_17090 [Barrientosiimonas marina]|uniref:Aminopyrimidine aminohydrolase n=1 Tax=Lentibacillus kimchii TaxID=1542911 RepID=A0ABW2UVS7_9BACI
MERLFRTSEHELQQLKDIVVITSYFEYMFWDMAEDRFAWPVEITIL